MVNNISGAGLNSWLIVKPPLSYPYRSHKLSRKISNLAVFRYMNQCINAESSLSGRRKPNVYISVLLSHAFPHEFIRNISTHESCASGIVIYLSAIMLSSLPTSFWVSLGTGLLYIGSLGPFAVLLVEKILMPEARINPVRRISCAGRVSY